MVQPPADQQVPLVVDLDGTLIDTDLLWESLAQSLRRNPLSLFLILFWWTRGRAFLKRKLSHRVRIDPAALPVNQRFLTWVREQKAFGRKIILATASDLEMVKPVADYFRVFDDVLASDGHTNLRGPNKLKALVERYGQRGFDYAGNSSVDLGVWPGVRKAVVVNASAAVQKQAAQIAEIGESFCETYSPIATLKSVLNELFIRSGYLVAILAGVVLAIAFPRVDFAGGAWIAPGLLAFATQSKKGADAFRVGMLAGVIFWLVSLYWLLEIPYRWHSIPIGPGIGWLALSLFLCLFSGAWTWLVAIRRPRETGSWDGRILWSLTGAVVWVALEMIRARILGGFPWNFLGTSQFQMIPLIQIAAITGVYGISFLVVWTSLSFYSAGRMIFAMPNSRFAWQAEIFPPLFAVAVVFAGGEIKANRAIPVSNTLRVACVQPSIPQTLIWDDNENAVRFQQLIQLSKIALSNQLDVLIWPESAVPELTQDNYQVITNLVCANHVCLIFNSDDVVPRPDAKNEYDNDVYNAAFLFNPDGSFPQIYHKQKLVMFGEYIPLVRWLPFVKWFTPISGGYSFGHVAVQFDLAGHPLSTSPLICYEDMFPQVGGRAAAGGADFFVNVTNDGWFGQSAEQWQHENGSIFRAVENGIPLVRCCNNGVTCWIDPAGRQRQIFRDDNGTVYGAGSMTFELPLQKHEPTFYTRHGDVFGWTCVAIAILLGGSKWKGNRKTVA